MSNPLTDDGSSDLSGKGAAGSPDIVALTDPVHDHLFRNIGIGVSVPWLLLIIGYVALSWEKFLQLEPNAVGDFLAGAFAPLAFLWLVLGFFQQGRELRFSGRALTLQSVELANSVSQQRELVSVTRDQLKLEGSILQRQEDELRRNSQPLLRLQQGGSSPIDRLRRNYQFSVSNLGKRCTDVKVSFSDIADSFAFGLLETGRGDTFWRAFEPRGKAAFLITITFVDERMISGHRTFTVVRDDDQFVIQQIDDETAFA